MIVDWEVFLNEMMLIFIQAMPFILNLHPQFALLPCVLRITCTLKCTLRKKIAFIFGYKIRTQSNQIHSCLQIEKFEQIRKNNEFGVESRSARFAPKKKCL